MSKYRYTISKIDANTKFDEVLNYIRIEGGSQPPKNEHIYEPREGYVRFIQNRDYSNESHITYIKNSSKNKLCNESDIMIDKYGEAGKIRYGLLGAYNVALSKISVLNDEYKEFIRDFLSQDDIRKILSKSSQASTRASLNESTFIGLKIPILDEQILEDYQKSQLEILKYELHLNKETHKLKLLKELLLSKYFD